MKYNSIPILEKTLEDIIYDLICYEDEYGINMAKEKGFSFLTEKYSFNANRQVKICVFGIADIILFNKPTGKYKVSFSILELKKDEINLSTYEQAFGYVSGLIKYYKEVEKLKYNEIDWNIILIGNIVTPSLFVSISNNSRLSAYVYTFNSVTGLTLEKVTTILNDEQAFLVHSGNINMTDNPYLSIEYLNKTLKTYEEETKS